MIALRMLAIYAIACALALAAPVRQESYMPPVSIGVVPPREKRADEPKPSSSMPSIRYGVVPTPVERAEKSAPSSSMASIRIGVVPPRE